MKQIIRRSFSLLLVLAIVVSLFAGLTITASAAQPTSAADVDYVTNGKYVYNWGKRDTTATFLTTYANSYYTGSYSYATLSALSGDSGTGTSFYSSPLGTAIHNMLVAKQTYTNSYDANKTLFQYTECEESSQSTMSSYYSGKELPNYWDYQETWNREHTWPNSKGLGGSDEDDVMMIKPTWVNENSSRGNTAYGESGSYYDPNGNGQNMHGDVARLMLQHLMRWGNTGYFYGSGGVMENRAVLLKWLAEDPVDTWEMGRNDAVQQITGVRNVFVDYPELAFQLLGAPVPAGFVTPSGNGGTVTTYTVSATSNNTAWGTVSVSGRTITATPKNGYYVSGYTVTSGSATVTQNGNTFSVNPSSDCTVRINFAAKTAVTVSFQVPAGVTQASVSGYAGEAITLPTPNGTPTDNSHTYTFLGWVIGDYDNVTTQPATVYAAGTEYIPTASITLNALYRYSEGGGSGASGYSKITEQSELENGNYIIISSATGKALGTSVASGWLAAGSTYAKNATSISEATASTDVWTYTDGKLSTGDKYLSSAGAKNISVGNTATVWTFTVASGAWTIKNGNNILSYNSSGWRPYSGGYGSDKTFYVFKEGSVGTSYYTTNLTNCAHTHTQQVAAIAASCTAVGYTAGVYCTDCQTYISGHTELPKIDHSYNNGVVTTPATCTAVGVKTFTCTACGAIRTEDVPALGHSYGAFTSNHNGTHSKTCSRCQDKVTEDCSYTSSVSGATTTYTCSVCAYSYSSTKDTYTVIFNDCGSLTTVTCIDGDSVTLPTTGSCSDENYTFAGWVAAAINPESTTAPAILAGTYEPTANVTLYALYTRTESTGGTSGLVKMKAGDTLADGDEIVIIANGTTVALYQETINSSYVNKYDFDNNINTVLADDKNYLTVNAVSGGFTLGDETNGYLSSSSNSLYVKSTVQTWTLLDLEDGTFKLQSDGRNLSYRSDLTTQYWRMGGTSYGTSGKTVLDLYKVSGAGATTYYTTSPVAVSSCDHSNLETVAAVAASCTTAGNNLYYYCPDCDKYFADSACNVVTSVEAQTIAALGHNYQQTAHADATCTEDGYTTYSCANCGDSYTNTIPAIGHNYDAQTGECANCGNQLTQHTVSFTVPAGIDAISPISAVEGAKITLPTPTGTLLADAQNYVFAGWVTTDVSNATDTEFFEAGEYTVTGNVTFKALYAWVDAGESFGDEGVYQLLTESDAANLASGWTLIIANDGKCQSKTMALAGFANSGNDKFVGKNVTVSSNTITLPATTEVQEFTVVKEGNYFYLISDYTDSEGTEYYLTSCTNTANANNITLTDTPTAAAKWVLTYHEDGTAKLTAQGSWTANTIQFNSGNYGGFFSCYGETYYGAETMPSNIYGIRIFASNPVYHYTTAPVQHCDHRNVTWTDNEDGTCTATCDDCGHVTISNQEHAWVLDADAEGTVAATCLNGGKEGYVCSNCGATKLEDTEALGHDYVGQETTAPTCSAAGEMTYTCSRCDDTYTDAILAIDHTFADGTCTMCGASLYVRVTEAPENWEGEYLIVYVGNNDAKVFDGRNDAANNFTVGTFYGEEGNESNLICVPNPDDYTVMFDPANSGYRIMNADANWWSYTAAKNGFSTNTNTSLAGTYNISLDANGNAVIKNAGNYTIKFNTQSSQFRFYGTSIYTTVKLYEKYGTCHHNWVLDETASTAAICTAAGNNVYVCSLCQETKNETVAALNHDYQYETVAATCTDEGYTICTCSRCDYEDIPDYSITPALGHSFTIEPDVTDTDHYLAPTATEDGLMYYQCDRCGAWDEEGVIIPALGVVTSKTYTMLTADDFESYETALANVGQFIIVAEADGIYYVLSVNGNGTVLNAVPITVSGTSTTVSSDSGIAALIPDYEATNFAETETGLGFRNADGNYLHLNSNSMNFNATAENGLFTVAKAYTNDTFTLSVAATGKYLVFNGEAFTMATSKTNAAKLYIFVSNTVDITYNNAIVSELTVDADSEGTLGYILNLNAANVIAAWSSDNEAAIMIEESTGTFLVGSTGTANVTVSLYTYDANWQNYQVYTATISVTISGTVVEAPKLLTVALVLNNAIDVVYTAKIPAGYTNAKLTVNGTEITEYTVENNGDYRFTYTGITPQCMGDNLSATLTAVKAGTTYSDILAEYSVRQYCVNMLAKEEVTGELRTLLSDLLAYGAAAQVYTDYKTDALVNVGSDIINPTYSTFTSLTGFSVSFNGTADDGYRWVSAGLTLTNSVAMTFRFYAESIENLTVNVAINGRTQSFTGDDFAAVDGKENMYEVSFTGICAEEFADAVTASFYQGGTQIGNSVSYSVNTYVQSKQNSENTALQALVKALYNYGVAADAYANLDNT